MGRSSVIRMRFSGHEELAANLDRIQSKGWNRAMRESLRKAGGRGAKAAKSKLTNRLSGQSRRALGFLVKSYKSGKVLFVIIGMRRGFKTTIEVLDATGKETIERRVDPANIAHLIDKGRKAETAPAGKLIPVLIYKRGRSRWVFVKRVKASRGSNFIAAAERVMQRYASDEFARDFMASIDRITLKNTAQRFAI